MEKSVYTIAKILGRFIKNDRVRIVVEVGAKDCTESVGLAERFPQARVYAFECNPATIPLCRQRTVGIAAITLIEHAISNQTGLVKFFAIDQEKTRTSWPDGNPGASSLLKASGNYPKETYIQQEVIVSATTLASFMEKESISHVDLLWLDIQGAELMALQGAGEQISNISVIHLEVEFMEIYTGQPLMGDVQAYLRSHGFSLYAFTNFGRYSADAVFVNHRLHRGRPFWRDRFIFHWYRWVWSYALFAGRRLKMARESIGLRAKSAA